MSKITDMLYLTYPIDSRQLPSNNFMLWIHRYVGLMSFCGKACQPQEILRELEAVSTSTQPIKVKTDAGVGYIKAINNPIGQAALARELVAAELGTWLGLKIPDYAIVPPTNLDIRLGRTAEKARGPFFFSRAVDAEPFDGDESTAKAVRPQSDIALLVVFDTWIRNLDRYGFGDGAHPNFENLLTRRKHASKEIELIPIDHSHVFSYPTWSDISSYNAIEDPNVYGRFPVFANFLPEAAVYDGINKLKTLDRKFVEECVNGIPSEWEPSQDVKNKIIDFIVLRAEYVCKSLPWTLLPQPRIEGLDGK